MYYYCGLATSTDVASKSPAELKAVIKLRTELIDEPYFFHIFWGVTTPAYEPDQLRSERGRNLRIRGVDVGTDREGGVL